MKHRVINGVDYLQVPGHPGYYISDYGDIYSMYRRRKLKQHDNAGYKMVFLKQGPDHKGHWQYIHRLKALVFLPAPLPGQIWVNHKDGRKENNSVGNLEWSTVSENIQHSYTVLKRKAPAGPDHYATGKHPPATTREKMSAAKKGTRHPKYEGDYITPLGIFSSAIAAGAAAGITPSTIIHRCKTNKKKLPGYSFEPAIK